MELTGIECLINQIDNTQDLKKVNEFVRERYSILEKRVVRSFKVGDEVSFVYKGESYSGVIEKINRKTVSIRYADGKHFGKAKVSASLIQ